MFQNWARKMIFSVAALGACAAVAAACGIEPPSVVKLPAGVERGTVAGNDFVAVTQKGKIIKVDLRRGRVTDLGAPGEKLSSFIDVADGKALVASPGKAYVIDLKTGKTVHWASFRGETVHGLGLIGKGRAFVHTGTTVAMLDFVWGASQGTIDLGAAPKQPRRRSFSPLCQRVGQRLYVTNGSTNEMLAIDLDKGKVSEKIALPGERLGGIRVVGDKALLLDSRLGYGVLYNSLGELDLKTKKYSLRKFASRTGLTCSLTTAPDGTLFVVEPHQAHRCEASGKLTALLPAKEPGRLVGFWRGSALVASGTELKVVALPKAIAPATAARK